MDAFRTRKGRILKKHKVDLRGNRDRKRHKKGKGDCKREKEGRRGKGSEDPGLWGLDPVGDEKKKQRFQGPSFPPPKTNIEKRTSLDNEIL